MKPERAMTIVTESKEWGFYGSITRHADPPTAWNATAPVLIAASGSSGDAVRAFLDSRWGRHFADDVANGLADGQSLPSAIEWATTRWMGWRTRQSEERDYQTPRGLPLLVGLIRRCELELATA